MEPVLNTLYVQTQGAYLHLDHDTIIVEVEREKIAQTPLLHLSAVVVFGNVLVSPFLTHRLAAEGMSLVYLSATGRFKARMIGPTSGNVLLRVTQHEIAADQSRSLPIARAFIAGKAQNSRSALLRSARDAKEDDALLLKHAAERIGAMLSYLERTPHIDAVRGIEGDIARTYFEHFGRMVKADRKEFPFDGRNRRPPRDPMNALLSFLYAILAGDCASALETVGLDPQVGFMHALRPGRVSLALDLMEEFRVPMVDRIALALVNRRTVNHEDFDRREGGAVGLNEKGRKKVIIAYQEKKREETTWPTIKKKVPVGLIPQLQARLLARHLRGDIDCYIPYLPRLS